MSRVPTRPSVRLADPGPNRSVADNLDALSRAPVLYVSRQLAETTYNYSEYSGSARSNWLAMLPPELSSRPDQSERSIVARFVCGWPLKAFSADPLLFLHRLTRRLAKTGRAPSGG